MGKPLTERPISYFSMDSSNFVIAFSSNSGGKYLFFDIFFKNTNVNNILYTNVIHKSEQKVVVSDLQFFKTYTFVN